VQPFQQPYLSPRQSPLYQRLLSFCYYPFFMKKIGENVVRIEADALLKMADRLSGEMGPRFERVIELLHCCTGRVIVTGMGKSGIIGRKMAATFSSTGTPSFFLHPAEAVHGDLGILVPGDLVLALSMSGETEEIIRLLATIKRLEITLVAMTGEMNSTLAQAADVALDCSVAKEACSLGLAPTASTTTMLALGDALAVALAEKKGFKEEDFASLHPGGKLGKKLARVETLMHTGDMVPRVSPETRMPDVIYEMSRKGLGMTTVVNGDRLVGLISDGDLRRLLERRGKDVMDLTAAECMTRSPKTIDPQEFAVKALNVMERMKITSLPVVDETGKLHGVLHLHDLWGTEMV
jgi:arabinose-5-phosphate isomerase